jgi:L-lactate dehydrogenase
MPDIAGVKDVTVALPHMIGGDGIIATFPPALSDEEQNKLNASASIVRKAIDELG